MVVGIQAPVRPEWRLLFATNEQEASDSNESKRGRDPRTFTRDSTRGSFEAMPRDLVLGTFQSLCHVLHRKASNLNLLCVENGRGCGIRTHGLLRPRQALYQAELIPDEPDEMECRGRAAKEIAGDGQFAAQRRLTGNRVISP